MVDYKTIGQICSNIFAGGTPSTKRADYYDGNIPWIRSGEIDFNVIETAERNITELGYKESSARKIRKNSVVMAMTGATVAKSAVVSIETTANQSVCAMETNESIANYKYVFHCLAEDYLKIKSSAQGALTSLNLAMINNIVLPIPSLQEQERIVGILDTFTAAIDNLKKQIEERRKQYEFYRDQLLDLEGKEGVEMVPLKNIADIGTGSSNTNEGLDEGFYPFYTRGKEVLRKNEYEFNETAIITAGDGVGVGKVFHFVSGKYALHQRAYRIHINKEDMNPRFIYYYMVSTFETYIRMKSFFAAVTSVRKPMLYSYPIPKCPLSQQQQIVAKLDAFEASIANLEQQLAMRQKQYEYYRNKLLTFD